ncbi:MAG: large conductance mechanosensitive channel [bacterium P201]|nr:MAG: large conductance mechanosensitive channel [bacterium P201]
MAKKSTFWSDFKAFITRGNVIDMAVGVVIGGAFGKIVTGLVNYIINPVISIITGGVSLENVKTVLVAGVEATETTEAVAEVAIQWGNWIQTIIDFLIVALCIFLVLRVIMKAKNMLEAKKNAEAAAKAAEEAAKAEEAKKDAEAEEAARVARQKELEDSALRQEQILAEIKEILKNK